MKKQNTFPTPLAALALTVSLTHFAPTTHAADFTWDAGDTNNGVVIDPASGSWNKTAGNLVWNNAGVNTEWADANTAIFAGADATYTITLEENVTASSVRFNNSGYTLTGSGVTLFNTGNLNVAAGVSASIGSGADDLVLQRTSGTLLIGQAVNTAAGTLNIASGAKVTCGGTVHNEGNGTAVNVSGTLESSGRMRLGSNSGTGVTDVTLNILSGGVVHSLTDVWEVGYAASSIADPALVKGTIVVGNGGTLESKSTYDGDVRLGQYGTGILTVQPGGTVKAGGIVLGNGGAAMGILNLDGGMANIGQLWLNKPNSVANFNGGTLKATGDQPLFLRSGSGSNNVRDGGLVIDSNGYEVGVAFGLAHSTIPGDNAIDGGLTKLGAGTLTLSSANNTYTGDTVVSNGTLRATSLGTGNVRVESGAALGMGENTLSLSLNGNLTLKSAVLEFNIQSLSEQNSIIVNGSLTPTGVTTISLPHTTLPLPDGDYYLLTVFGTAGGSAANFAAPSSPSGKSYTVNYSSGILSLHVATTGAVTSKVWMGDNAASLWDINTSPNWVRPGEFTPTVYLENDTVAFDNNAFYPGAVNIPGAVSPAYMTVSGFNSYTFSGAGGINGTGQVAVSSSGTTTLGTANGYTGGTIFDGGTLIITNNGTLGAATGDVTVIGGTLELSGKSLTNGAVTMAGGTLNNGTLTATSFTVERGTINASLAGIGAALTKTGLGTLTLTASNAHTGGTFLGNGTLVLNSSAGGAIPGPLEINASSGGATLRLGAPEQIADGTVLTYNVPGGVNVKFELQGFSETIAGLSDPGSTGVVAVRSAADNQGATPATLTLSGAGAYTYGGTIADASGTVDSPLSIVKSGTGIQTLGGSTSTVSYTGGTVINGGTLEFAGGNSVANNSAITLNGGTVAFSGGGTRTTQIDGAGTVLKEGANTLTLTGDFAYTGSTVVSNGTLRITGSLAPGNTVDVWGGTLDGSGTVSGPVTVHTNATLAPGVGLGTLTIGNSLTLAPGSITSVQVNKDTLSNDQVVGLTSVGYGGTLQVANQAGTLALGDSFPLFISTAFSGNFASISGSPGAGLAWNFNPTNGTLSVVAGNIAPTPTNVTIKAISGRMVLEWPNGQGWILQSQTNLLSVSLGTNWVDVSTTSPYTNASPAAPASFYRLIYTNAP